MASQIVSWKYTKNKTLSFSRLFGEIFTLASSGVRLSSKNFLKIQEQILTNRSNSYISAATMQKQRKTHSSQIDKMADFRAKCRQVGLKMTPQRMAVYKTLIESKEHPSAEMVHRKIRRVLPNISLDTVNRTLLTLSKIGTAFVVEGSGDAKRYDGNLESHQHFKCIKCKRIIDFHHKPFDNILIPRGLSKKFTVLKKTVYLEGICNSCRKEH